jgi:beta-hydroxylase
MSVLCVSVLRRQRERVMRWAVVANNARIRTAEPTTENPRSLDGLAGHRRLTSRFDAIRSEWDEFEVSQGRLPRIEQVLGEDQGNDGAWRAGLLVAHGRPVRPLADRFPVTVAALQSFPGLRSALWSVLEPGTELPEHSGGNAGVLRYHLGVATNDETALRVADTVVPYREGVGVLFDDTVAHAAWNRGSARRVTLFCELLRPLPAPASWANLAVQELLALDHRYRLAPSRAAEWHHALNPAPAPEAVVRSPAAVHRRV